MVVLLDEIPAKSLITPALVSSFTISSFGQNEKKEL
jgi:hypothetical protein